MTKRKYSHTPKWFQAIPKESESWIASLHNTVRQVFQNHEPPTGHRCCPHVYKQIEQNQHIITWKHNNHYFILPFDKLLSDLLGSEPDMNKYELAAKHYQNLDYWEVTSFGSNYKIIQPIDTAVKMAPKKGLIKAFNIYDSIILYLANKLGNQIEEQHEKTFSRYEKCRDLALRTSEIGEKLTATQMAYQQGGKLIAQFTELIKAPTITLEDWIWFSHDSVCDNCLTRNVTVYMHKLNQDFCCLACIYSR